MPKLEKHGRALKRHYPVYRNNNVLPTLFRYIHPNDGKRKERCQVRILEWTPWMDTYAFCGEIARWQFGEQLVCHFHGGMIVGGIIPTGINHNGKWND